MSIERVYGGPVGYILAKGGADRTSHDWRDHPQPWGRFHPETPDDLQVIVQDGGPRMTDHRPELVWVRVAVIRADAFTGRVRNQPRQLTSVRAGSLIHLVAPRGGEHLLQVGEKSLRERKAWIIHPCSKCGLTELFDAPSDLMRRAFPDTPADAVVSMFTAFRGACGGVQVVPHKSHDINDEDAEQQPPRMPWRRFWK